MPLQRPNLLCSYRYNSLDRLVAYTPSAQASTQRFYLKDHLATEIQGTLQRSIMQHDDQLLAQQQRQGVSVENHLLATDQQRSVLNVVDARQFNPLAYTPYGHRPFGNGLLSLLGFNGERRDPLTGWYLLGNGYRAFNPVLMRLHSPDSLSPFGEGGLNAYAYCAGDPVNESDPTGHSLRFKFTGPARRLANNVMIFSNKVNSAKILNVDIHGDIGLVKFANKIVNGKQLSTELRSHNVIFSDFDEAHLVACFSANPGSDGSLPLAQSFADATGLPTTGYMGRVFPTDSAPIKKGAKSSELVNLTNYSVASDNPFKRSDKEYKNFTYSPVKFHPPQKDPTNVKKIRQRR